jgi:lysophospholipase L1-like esterase
MKSGKRMKTKKWIGVLCIAGAMSASAVNRYFTGAGADNNFSTAENWDAAPVSSDSIFILTEATTAEQPAILDAGFTADLYTINAQNTNSALNANTYMEVASGVNRIYSNLNVGSFGGGTHRNYLTLKSGSRLANKYANGGGTTIGKDAAFRSGQMTLEPDVSFQTAILTVNPYGTVTFEFGTNSVSTLATSKTDSGGANTIDGLIQVDLAALTTEGSYTLIDSSSTNLLMAGALKIWLDGEGGSVSGTGSFATNHFEVLNAGNADWTHSLADSNQDLIFTVAPNPLQSVSPTDPDIHIFGTQYITRGTNSVSFQRHSDEVLGLPQSVSRFNPLKARVTSGIVLGFKTDSRIIEMTFRMLDFENRGSGFGVYQDGELIAEHAFDIDEGNPDQTFTIHSVSPGTASVFEVVMPSWSNTEWTDMKIAGDASLFPCDPPAKKKYVAFGDSITHGTGQESYSHWTYPFKLSRELNVELFNIAVGGSQVSVSCGEMMAGFPPVDVITILYGYNDWRADVPKADYQTRMENLIAAIRSHQPDAQIFCITPTYSTNTESPDGQTTLDDYREAIDELVAARQAVGDLRIHSVQGDEIITSDAQLQDPAHLTPDGATDLANGLFDVMNPVVNPLTFDRWGGLHDLSGSDAAALSDPDGDGVSNLLEFAMGGIPTSGSDPASIFRLQPFAPAGDAAFREFTFRRLRDAALKGLTYHLEWTDNLTSGFWTVSEVEETAADAVDAEYEQVVSRIALPEDRHHFVRLKVAMSN